MYVLTTKLTCRMWNKGTIFKVDLLKYAIDFEAFCFELAMSISDVLRKKVGSQNSSKSSRVKFVV